MGVMANSIEEMLAAEDLSAFANCFGWERPFTPLRPVRWGLRLATQRLQVIGGSSCRQSGEGECASSERYGGSGGQRETSATDER